MLDTQVTSEGLSHLFSVTTYYFKCVDSLGLMRNEFEMNYCGFALNSPIKTFFYEIAGLAFTFCQFYQREYLKSKSLDILRNVKMVYIFIWND